MPGAKLSGSEFLQFWVSYSAGSIAVGTGAPGSQPPCYSWLDPSPAASIEHVGLSSWDHHVAYRNIQITPPMAVAPPAGTSAGAAELGASIASPVASLQDQCMAALQRSLGPATVCTVLALADVMRPAAEALRDGAIASLAEQLPKVLAAHPAGLQALSFDCMLDVLKHGALVRGFPLHHHLPPFSPVGRSYHVFSGNVGLSSWGMQRLKNEDKDEEFYLEMPIVI